MSLFIPITKVDVEQRLVYATLSAEVADKSGEILELRDGKAMTVEFFFGIDLDVERIRQSFRSLDE
jgi:hypothetical protein